MGVFLARIADVCAADSGIRFGAPVAGVIFVLASASAQDRPVFLLLGFGLLAFGAVSNLIATFARRSK